MNDKVIVKIRANNSIGWGEYSEDNSVQAVVETEPAEMDPPEQGINTTPLQIEVTWTALTGDDTGNSPITSYEL